MAICQECGNEIQLPVGQRGRKPKLCEACRRPSDGAVVTHCLQCGKVIPEQPERGRKRKYCCPAHRIAHNTARGQKRTKKPYREGRTMHQHVCEGCGCTFEAIQKKARFHSVECANAYTANQKRKRTECVCQNPACGKTFMPKAVSRTSYCSRECAFRCVGAWRAPAVREFPQQTLTCLSCQKPFVSTRGGERYCSEECRERGRPFLCEHCGNTFYAKAPRACCSDDCAHQKALKDQRDKYEPVPEFEATCAECGKTYTTNRTGSRYCGEDCVQVVAKRAKKESNDRRRATETGAFVQKVSRKAIFIRDGWICQLCGLPVDPKLRYPDYMSASLDHIMPLAKGGTHETANVQLAHWICNSRKRDQIDATG